MKKSGLVYALITALVFTTLEPVSKLIAEDINPYSITFIRFLIGSLLLLPFAIQKIRKEKIHIMPKDIAVLTLLGVLCICFSMVMLQLAVKMADAPSLIAIIFSANSVFTILFAMVILKEKMTKGKFIAVILCIIGVCLCADFSKGTNLLSVTLALVAALCFSLYTALSKKYMKKLNGVIQSSFSFLIGSIVLLIVLVVMRVKIVPSINPYNTTILLYLGIVVTGVGYWAYFKAIEKGGAMAGSFAFFIKPILTPFATFFINGIKPSVTVFVAVLFIVTGSYFATYSKKANISFALFGRKENGYERK